MKSGPVAAMLGLPRQRREGREANERSLELLQFVDGPGAAGGPTDLRHRPRDQHAGCDGADRGADAAQALALATCGYVLETGEIVLSGTGKELLADDRIRAAYLGEEIAT